MTKKSLAVVSVEESLELSLDETCHAYSVPLSFILEMIEHGIIEPRGASQEIWRFDTIHLHRIRTATHLHHDLEINMPGVALILDMLDDMQKMQARLDWFEKQFT